MKTLDVLKVPVDLHELLVLQIQKQDHWANFKENLRIVKKKGERSINKRTYDLSLGDSRDV